MRRIGKRGEGQWKRISWDEALTELTGRIKGLRDAGTPEKFMFHYGRMKASHSKLIGMFLATYGTGTIGDHTSICEGAKWTGQELTWGTHYDNWDFDHAAYVLNFGSNIFEAHTNHIPTAHRLIARLAEHALKLVTFDVRLSNTAAKSTAWIPIRPGTDRAAVLALCQVIMAEDLYRGDGEEFLTFCKVTPDRNATLADKVAALKTHLAPFTPEWAEGITSVPAATLVRLAREFATIRPACVISYRGTVAHHHGADTERAVQMLAAITGAIDAPGTRCKAVGPKWKYPEGPRDKPETRKLKILDGLPGAAALPTHHVSHQVLQMIKDGRTGRPDVYLWYYYAPVYANGQVQESIDILKDESLLPFTVCVSPFYDESAALANMILPDTPYTERWSWEDGPSADQIAEYAIRQPVIAPLGEARDFADVCCDLADRLGFPLGFKNHEEFVRLSCDMTPVVKAAGGFEHMKAFGVTHDPADTPAYHSYRKILKAEASQADGVILDADTGVWWNWKKAGVASADEAETTSYARTKNGYKGLRGAGHRRHRSRWLQTRQAEQVGLFRAVLRDCRRQGVFGPAVIDAGARTWNDEGGRTHPHDLQGHHAQPVPHGQHQIPQRNLSRQPGLDQHRDGGKAWYRRRRCHPYPLRIRRGDHPCPGDPGDRAGRGRHLASLWPLGVRPLCLGPQGAGGS
ncbi:MAG: anaerobic dehydrogenase typically selenocysteine-containing [Xanthobacteraceae bacterium]|nr:MAG: anaerobic dehydrogenase typically selenocysteine-containing [Xanthobacteraceae bacterium]